jgi:hypothetical protein
MLATSLSELYSSGGTIWMHPITLLFLINVGIAIFVLLSWVNKKQWLMKWIEAIKQLGGLALAWGAFATLVGLFQAFGALEESKDVIPFQVIMGGLKVALITVLYGLIVFCISQLVYILFKLKSAGGDQ